MQPHGQSGYRKHCKIQGHQQQTNAQQSQSIQPFTSQQQFQEVKKKTEAELKMVCSVDRWIQHFFSLSRPSVTNGQEGISRFKIAGQYHSASTKATCMLNLPVAPALFKDLVQCMKVQPFSIAIDGSNDTGLEKMNSVTVHLFDLNDDQVATCFLNMCSSKSSTASRIFTILKERIAAFFGLDNQCVPLLDWTIGQYIH